MGSINLYPFLNTFRVYFSLAVNHFPLRIVFVLLSVCVIAVTTVTRYHHLVMAFTVQSLHTMEKEFNTVMKKVLKTIKISSPSELNHAALMKLNKDPLSNVIENLFQLFANNLELCKAAASTIDQLKTEQFANQQEIIKICPTVLLFSSKSYFFSAFLLFR